MVGRCHRDVGSEGSNMSYIHWKKIDPDPDEKAIIRSLQQLTSLHHPHPSCIMGAVASQVFARCAAVRHPAVNPKTSQQMSHPSTLCLENVPKENVQHFASDIKAFEDILK